MKLLEYLLPWARIREDLGVVVNVYCTLTAWYGIEEADNENSCRTANSTQDCVLLIELVPPISGMLRRGQIPHFNYDLYQYWMAGATVCGVVWAFINALTLIAFSELIRTHLGVLAKLERKVEDE